MAGNALSRSTMGECSGPGDRTIADLAGEARIAARHLAEALQYRGYEARRMLER